MGKKDKKKKGLGKAKTEAKVAKKAEKANKKARAADGEVRFKPILTVLHSTQYRTLPTPLIIFESNSNHFRPPSFSFSILNQL